MRRAVKRLQAEKCVKQDLKKKRNLEFQLVLWASSSHILVTQGYFLLVLIILLYDNLPGTLPIEQVN